MAGSFRQTHSGTTCKSSVQQHAHTPIVQKRLPLRVHRSLSAGTSVSSASSLSAAACGHRSTARISASCRTQPLQRAGTMASATPNTTAAAAQDGSLNGGRSLICTSITATTVAGFLAEIEEATNAGVDVVELRLDFIENFSVERDLPKLMAACRLPYIVTYRPTWEGGNYEGPEAPRLAALKYAALKGAPFVDVEHKAAAVFFASPGEVPLTTKIILSSHNFKETPSAAQLRALAKVMQQDGADIVKIATMANDVADCAAVVSLLKDPVAPTIALAMGEKGQLTRLLAGKFGGFLTFAALNPKKASAPGQPTIAQLKDLYNFKAQTPATRVYGIIGKPVSHSRSPLIHNTAFQHIAFDGCYVPLLVDDLQRFLAAFPDTADFSGFSVTIPHKEPALRASAEVDPVAASIGAVNTLVRQADGSFKGYNTDWVAAIEAIEKRLASGSGASSSGSGESPLKGKTVVVIGAGGAGRALAFGAASRGARVVIANRNNDRAKELAAATGPSATAVEWSELQGGKVSGDVLANSTSVGMAPQFDVSPVPASVVRNFSCVFDAVYTPLWTRLLRDARDAGCMTVDGLQMFVGQAVRQFELFTGKQAPVEVMEKVMLDAMNATKK